MANTITISVTPQDLHDLEQNPDWSATKIFRSAMRLQRSREEFLNIYDIWDFVLELRRLQENTIFLNKEIQRRNERIDSLQDVLAQKELTQRRLRKIEQADNGSASTNSATQDGISVGATAPEILAGLSE